VRCHRLHVEHNDESNISSGLLRQVWGVDHQRRGNALQHGAPEFLPFNRPILAGIEKFHEGRPVEQFEDQGHEVVGQGRDRQRMNASIKSIEYGVEVLAGARDDRVRDAFLVRKEAIKRADLCARAGGDFGHCRAFVPFLGNDVRRSPQYRGHPQFAIGPLRHMN